VDDNATNRRILSLQGQSWEMIPREAQSPSEALDWIRGGEPFDVAILDMQMPDMDGLMLAREIRRLRDARALPLVILTSLGARSDLESEISEGLHLAAVLAKPIKPSQLFDVLVSLFAGRPEDEHGASITPSPQFDSGLATRRPLHILLAEDHPTNQMLALRLLERLGYRADVAGNGLEVLAALRRQHYDVVLMDMQMPEMDGLEATRRIRETEADSGREAVHIVAMTANATQADREECLLAGMNDYVSKPIRVPDLVAALERTPAPHRPAETPREAPAEVEEATAPAEVGVASHPGEGSEVLDPAALERLREMAGGDAAFVETMIESYLATSPPLLRRLRSSLESGDAPEMRMVAHTLKSGSADLGARALSALCARLEAMARSGTLEGATPLVAEAEDAYAQVEAALARVAMTKGEDPLGR
jgi:CheY-like chemotaxis protein